MPASSFSFSQRLPIKIISDQTLTVVIKSAGSIPNHTFRPVRSSHKVRTIRVKAAIS